MTIPRQTFTPTVHQQTLSPVALGGGEGFSGGSLAELTVFMEKQQRMHMERDVESKAEKAELEAKFEAKLEAQRQQMEAQWERIETQRKQIEEEAKAERDGLLEEMEAQRKVMEAKLAPACAISEEQLASLQSRIETLHAAQLLTDDELSVLEDVCVDIIELETSVGGQLTTEMAQANPTIAKACKLAAVCGRMGSDAALARQLRRRFT